MILVGGEALYDLVSGRRATCRATRAARAFNTARTIGRLEQPVAYLGRLSTDRFGSGSSACSPRTACASTPSCAPTTRRRWRSPRSTTTASPRYRFYERGTSAPGLTPEAALAALPPRSAILHVGTLGLTLEPVATALEAVVERLGGQRAGRRRPEHAARG